MVFDSSAYRLRWAVNSSRWEPEEMEWRFVLGLLPEDECAAVLKCAHNAGREKIDAHCKDRHTRFNGCELGDYYRFKFKDDQKRALISRLLQRRCCQVALNLNWNEILIKRTKGRKPFLAKSVHIPEAPNFNYNVSHEGNFVVLASEPVAICGVDVAAPQQLRRGKEMGFEQIRKTFDKNFTQFEWDYINAAGTDDKTREDCFRLHWSLKEAFTKGRGDGIAFELSRCEFHLNKPWVADRATVEVDGVPQTGWMFSLHQLSDEHWVSVGRGPPSDVIDANGEFTGTFRQPELSPAELAAELEAPSPSFQLLSVCDLLPPDRLEEFEIAGGDVF